MTAERFWISLCYKNSEDSLNKITSLLNDQTTVSFCIDLKAQVLSKSSTSVYKEIGIGDVVNQSLLRCTMYSTYLNGKS